MKKLILSFLFFMPLSLFSQETEEASVDLLKVPASPAFIILGIQPTEIERPSSPTDFLLSIQNATQDFNTLPRDYAVEFNPFWTFGIDSDNFTMAKFNGDQSIWKNIAQSTTLSIGTTPFEVNDSSEITSMGLGLKFSLLRGELAKDKNSELGQKQQAINNAVNDLKIKSIEEYKENDKEYKKQEAKLKKQLKKLKNTESTKEKEAINKEIQIHQDSMTTMVSNYMKKADTFEEIENQLKQDKEEFNEILSSEEETLERQGFKLDIAGAIALDFPGELINDGKLRKSGAWITGGQEWEEWSLLFSGRYFHEKEQNYAQYDFTQAENNMLDFGGKLVYENEENNLSLSAEYLYRWNSIEEVENSCKYDFRIEYAFKPNQFVAFTVGRQFDDLRPQFDGNLIAVLDLILGFGNKRKGY